MCNTVETRTTVGALKSRNAELLAEPFRAPRQQQRDSVWLWLSAALQPPIRAESGEFGVLTSRGCGGYPGRTPRARQSPGVYRKRALVPDSLAHADDHFLCHFLVEVTQPFNPNEAKQKVLTTSG